jgi:hypothetical protein
MLEGGPGGRRSVGAVQETLEASFVPDGLFLADDLGDARRAGAASLVEPRTGG